MNIVWPFVWRQDRKKLFQNYILDLMFSIKQALVLSKNQEEAVKLYLYTDLDTFKYISDNYPNIISQINVKVVDTGILPRFYDASRYLVWTQLPKGQNLIIDEDVLLFEEFFRELQNLENLDTTVYYFHCNTVTKDTNAITQDFYEECNLGRYFSSLEEGVGTWCIHPGMVLTQDHLVQETGKAVLDFMKFMDNRTEPCQHQQHEYVSCVFPTRLIEKTHNIEEAVEFGICGEFLDPLKYLHLPMWHFWGPTTIMFGPGEWKTENQWNSNKSLRERIKHKIARKLLKDTLDISASGVFFETFKKYYEKELSTLQNLI